MGFMRRVQDGNEVYGVPSVVLSELSWVLSSFYKFNKEKIADHLGRLLTEKRFRVVYEADWNLAVERWKSSSIKLNDWFIWSYMKEGDEIVSFDKHLDKLKGIKRIDPLSL